MLPFFIGSYFAYEVVVRVRSAILHEARVYHINMTCILNAACG